VDRDRRLAIVAADDEMRSALSNLDATLLGEQSAEFPRLHKITKSSKPVSLGCHDGALYGGQVATRCSVLEVIRNGRREAGERVDRARHGLHMEVDRTVAVA
jgi:hypothetical protein